MDEEKNQNQSEGLAGAQNAAPETPATPVKPYKAPGDPRPAQGGEPISMDVDAIEDQAAAQADANRMSGEKKSKTGIALAIIILLLGAAAGALFYFKDTPQVRSILEMVSTESAGAVALVNGEELSRDRFDIQVAQMLRGLQAQGQAVDTTVEAQVNDYVINLLIDEALLLEEAAQRGIVVSDAAVEEIFQNQVRAQFENEEAFQAELAEFGVSEEDVRDDIWRNLVLEQFVAEYVSPVVNVSDEEVRARYEESVPEGTDEEVFAQVEETIRQQLVAAAESAEVERILETLRADAEVEVLLP